VDELNKPAGKWDDVVDQLTIVGTTLNYITPGQIAYWGKDFPIYESLLSLPLYV